MCGEKRNSFFKVKITDLEAQNFFTSITVVRPKLIPGFLMEITYSNNGGGKPQYVINYKPVISMS